MSRHEIESALARKALVVPVLVGGATAVNLTGLPQSLADLPFHQAMELRDASFKVVPANLSFVMTMIPIIELMAR